MRLRNSLIATLALSLFAAPALGEQVASPRLALMGTVPIYWGEAVGFDELLAGDAPPHWARAVLEERFVLMPLDYLSADALQNERYLLMAQPRGLSAQENVALDDWVRGGGTLLLFADPMMTGESRFHVGDRRRPQDVALLSPILARWGLELVFDPAQPAGPHTVDHFGDSLPVNQRGSLRETGGAQYCTVSAEGLLAHCAIEGGTAMIVADAAMLDLTGPHEGSPAALRWLVSHSFDFGDDAGTQPAAAADLPRNQKSEAVTEGNHGHGTHHREASPP